MHFFSLLRGATYILITDFGSFIGYEDDILEVIYNFQVKGAKIFQKIFLKLELSGVHGVRFLQV